jgi:hypothetical protein
MHGTWCALSLACCARAEAAPSKCHLCSGCVGTSAAGQSYASVAPLLHRADVRSTAASELHDWIARAAPGWVNPGVHDRLCDKCSLACLVLTQGEPVQGSAGCY